MVIARGLAVILIACSLAAPAVSQKTPDLRLNGGGANGEAWDHEILASGSSVYVVWRDRRAGPNALRFERGDIYFNRSLDGGATWLPADVRLNLGSAPMLAIYRPRMAFSGAAVCVVWQDLRNNPTSNDRSDIYCNRSLDGGATWLPGAVRLDTGRPAGSSSSVGPCITGSGASFGTIWLDYRNTLSGRPDVYCNRSTDHGSTWQASDVLVSAGAPPASHFDWMSVTSWGSSIYVAWTSFLPDAHWFSRSLDGGASWLAPPIQVDHAPSTSLRNAMQLAAWGGSVYAVWSDTRNGNNGFDVFFNCSADSGATWQPADVRLDVGRPPGSASSSSPVIAAVNSSVHVVWIDHRLVPASQGVGNVHCNSSADFGTTWLPTDVRIDHDRPLAPSRAHAPQLATAGASVHVTWMDAASVAFADVYCNHSLDRGATWLPLDVRLNVGSAPGTSLTQLPRIAASGSSVYVAWQDDRGQQDFDLYFTLASGCQPYGTGTAGMNAFVPALSGSGDIAIGGTLVLGFDRGLGGTLGLLALGFQPASKVALPLLGGTLLVQPAGTSFFTLNGAAGVPGAGSRSILVPVPNDLSLLGLNANWQGLFIDLGAVQGVSMSNGLETWF